LRYRGELAVLDEGVINVSVVIVAEGAATRHSSGRFALGGHPRHAIALGSYRLLSSGEK
jgi:hypothetical protein